MAEHNEIISAGESAVIALIDRAAGHTELITEDGASEALRFAEAAVHIMNIVTLEKHNQADEAPQAKEYFN